MDQIEQAIRIQAGTVTLEGDLNIPETGHGIVLFAHGSGSSRYSPRNRSVARVLQRAGFGTLLMDLLTADEERIDAQTAHLRFDIPLLAERLLRATDWLAGEPSVEKLHVGLFGSSTGAAAALVAAAERPDMVKAVVSRGGRPDLAASAILRRVQAPTLLIVGGRDAPVIDVNRDALEQLAGEKALDIVPRASHLFEEPGALEEVARLAAEWFRRHLGASV